MTRLLTLGINGSGKDTVASELQKRDSSIKVISGSRIMFRALGFNVGIFSDDPRPTPESQKEMYKSLEEAPSQDKDQIMKSDFQRILLEATEGIRVCILSAHLALAKKDGDGVQYETGFLYDWYPQVFSGYAYLKANPSQIYERRESERVANTRDRGFLSISEIEQQQSLSDSEWSKLITMSPNIPSITIPNHTGRIDAAVSMMESFIKDIS